MTEIPEHLLKRSRERRAAAGLPTEGDAAPAAGAPAASTPAVPAAAPTPAVPAPPAPKPVAAPKPDPAYIRAAKTRRKMPFWAMGALSLLPVWAFLYLAGVRPQEVEATGPLALGKETYSKCSSCHQAGGQGGAGRPLNNGEVLKTFPHIEDMLNMVYTGSQAFATADLPVYGDPNREGGAHVPLAYNGSAMPQQGEKAGGALTDYEILAVVCHERFVLSGASDLEEYAEEFEKWCSPESEIFLGLEEGEFTFESEELGIGVEPRPAKP